MAKLTDGNCEGICGIAADPLHREENGNIGLLKERSCSGVVLGSDGSGLSVIV